MPNSPHLTPPYHYITLRLTPPTEHLALRHAIQKALQRTFGITRAGVGVDILTEEGVPVGGEEREVVVLKVSSGDARYVTSAVPTWSSPTMRVLKDETSLNGVVDEED